jgi:NTP pyrophosphatase (non-canonical NTP hydrolase)
MDPLKVFILLTEEIGEIACELKRTWSPNYAAFSKADLADELADVMVCVLALANRFEIDIGRALEEKLLHKDARRTWKSAGNLESVE